MIINDILVWLMYGIDLIGVVIICFGVLHAILSYVLGLFGNNVPVSIDQIRLELGRSIVLAVEFLLAADIIKTILTPDYYEIGMLGALVVIRTVLTYFLNLELEEIQK